MSHIIKELIGRLTGLTEKDFAWKVRWRMKNDKNPIFVILQDKYKVKEYAQDRGVRTAKLLFVTDRPETIPFDQLPRNCFIKANHGSGWNIYCVDSEFFNFKNGKSLVKPDGSLMDRNAAMKYKLTQEECIYLCKKWLRRRFSKEEWAYQYIEPKIIVEEALISIDGKEIKDYRIYTFQGVVKAISVGSPTYRRNRENVFFDPNWKEFKLTKYKEKVPDPLPGKPDNLQEMIRIAEWLGNGLDFVRVDLYDTTQGILLGEITIYPQSGHINTPTACPKFNKWLGDQWVLDKK